jgi:hypothetical protein
VIAFGVTSVSDGDLIKFAFKILGIVLLGRLVWILINLAVDRMQHHQTLDERTHQAIQHVAAGRARLPEMAPQDEPYWPNKAPHDSAARRLSAPVGEDSARYDLTGLVGTSGVLVSQAPPETPAETSGRHALTESIPAVTADEPAVVDGPRAIQLRVGGEVIPAVMLAWIDTMATACGFNPKPGQAVGVLWQFDGSDEITDADATPPAARWAGRLVAARLADDQPQFRALINSCGTDEVFSANVAALLTTCGVMLRRAGGESL